MVAQDSAVGSVALFMSAFLILFSSICFGQEDTASTAGSSSENPLRAGAKALQFQILEDFRLGSFDGSVISLKTQRSARTAIRIGVTISGHLRNGDYDTDDQTSSTRNSFEDEDENGMAVTLNIQRLTYRTSYKDANLFWGIGPTFTYWRLKSDDSTITYQGSAAHVEGHTQRSYSLSGGITGLVGVEWFMSKSLSLTAEYGLVVKYEYLSTERTVVDRDIYNGSVLENTHNDRAISREFGVSSLPVRFGVSVYF